MGLFMILFTLIGGITLSAQSSIMVHLVEKLEQLKQHF